MKDPKKLKFNMHLGRFMSILTMKQRNWKEIHFTIAEMLVNIREDRQSILHMLLTDVDLAILPLTKLNDQGCSRLDAILVIRNKMWNCGQPFFLIITNLKEIWFIKLSKLLFLNPKTQFEVSSAVQAFTGRSSKWIIWITRENCSWKYHWIQH